VCAKLTKLAGSLSGLSEERNRVVHDARFLSAILRQISRFQAIAKRRLEFDYRPEDVPTLHDLAARIQGGKREFINIWWEIDAELAALPPRQRPRLRKIVFSDLEKIMPETSEF
jgi:hypothetical protein